MIVAPTGWCAATSRAMMNTSSPAVTRHFTTSLPTVPVPRSPVCAYRPPLSLVLRTCDGAASARVTPARCHIGPLLALALVAPTGLGAQLPESALSVRGAKGEQVWWRSAEAPQYWPAALPVLTRAVRWRTLRPGLESGRLDLSGDGVAWRIAVVLARVEPARFRFALDTVTRDGAAAWTIDRARGAALAVNAGQFEGGSPWGWVVHGGVELQPPGYGPLSAALVVDRNGRIELLDPDEMLAAQRSGRVLEAFQSYPAILVDDGRVPEPLRATGRGVDLVHRDSRFGVCVLRDGRLLFALTRFMSPGSVLARLPFGPTTPEMAAIMGALGCRRAVLLDGGLSGQMALSDARSTSHRWPGLRPVPLGLLARPR